MLGRRATTSVDRRIAHKAITWLATVGLLASAFLLGPLLMGGGADEPHIDTAAPIERSQCAPCHVDLSRVQVEGLIFSHGNHLLIPCEGCHFRLPHRDDVTERVPMDACFACHGLNHGMQGELATGTCEDCHTNPESLRPESHGLTWAKEPHARFADANGVNGCMMCHEPMRDCDECHAREAPEVPPMPLAYHPMVTPREKGPSVKIYTSGDVEMSSCSYCHAHLDDASGKRLIFAHADHVGRNYRCAACHERFPHTLVGIERPDMLSCYRCHGMNHNSQGLVATPKCEACHPPAFELMPDDHTRRFIQKTHSRRAKAEPAYCAMCHESALFCTPCHNGKKVSPNAPGKRVIPIAHTDARWMGKHGKDYYAGEDESCGICHAGPFCEECHKTVVPHPIGFVENHKLPAGATSDDCGICHSDRRSCQDCHHSGVKNQDLIRENCVSCHPEMEPIPATGIKNKSYAEHAVHFDVGQSKGRPYRCYECHVSFGTSDAARAVEVVQGHDMRLCYGCHGALDPFNELIAPYSGRELCVRCHSDVDI